VSRENTRTKTDNPLAKHVPLDITKTFRKLDIAPPARIADTTTTDNPLANHVPLEHTTTKTTNPLAKYVPVEYTTTKKLMSW
jgi:hypothetical protein